MEKVIFENIMWKIEDNGEYITPIKKVLDPQGRGWFGAFNKKYIETIKRDDLWGNRSEPSSWLPKYIRKIIIDYLESKDTN